jgi:hypothetical protein
LKPPDGRRYFTSSRQRKRYVWERSRIVFRLLLVDRGKLRVAKRAEDGLYDVRDIQGHGAAVGYLRRFRGNRVALERLGELVEEFEPRLDAGKLTTDQLLDKVAGYVDEGRLAIAEQVERVNPPNTIDEKIDPPPVAQPQSAAPKTEKKLTYIEIRVIDDVTGDPVEWVRMAVRLPTGDSSYHTTDAKGLIRIDGIEPGSCDIWCDLKNPELTNTPGFIAMGEKKDHGDRPANVERYKRIPKKSGTRQIALITPHKVKDGESIDSIARANGWTWKELAKFNFGTDVPNEINKHLVKDVGCWKKTKDGYNYQFTDRDTPGIMYVPKKWEEDGLATGQTHVVRVRWYTFSPRMTVSFVLPGASADQVYPKYLLESADGEYSRELCPMDDLIPGDAYVQLVFDELEKGKTYTLTRSWGEEYEEKVFENLSFDEIVDQEREKPEGLVNNNYTGIMGESQTASLDWS